MFPALAIANLVSFLLSLVICLRAFRSLRASTGTNKLLRIFFKYFLYLTSFFALSFPALVWNPDSGTAVGMQQLIAFLFLSFSMGSFLQIPIAIWFGEKTGQIISWGIVCIGWIALIAGIILFEPAHWATVERAGIRIGYFVFTQPAFVRGLSGGVPIAVGIVGSIIYLVQGWRSLDSNVGRRSFSMGVGMQLLIYAGISNFFVFNATVAFAANLFASFFALVGLIVMVAGVYFTDVTASG